MPDLPGAQGPTLEGRVRCAGYLSDDRRVAFCTREEYAGDLNPQDTTPTTYAHVLDGDCRCGLSHGASSNGHVPIEPSRTRKREESDEEMGGLEWFARHTGLDHRFLAALDLYEEGESVVFTFTGLSAEKLRSEDKKGEWRHNATNPPLWPMPPKKVGSTVYLTEGESDCCTLLKAGFEAYAVTKGAHTPLDSAACVELARRGVEHLIVVPDTDDVGQQWGERQARIAQGAGLRASIVDLRPFASPLGSDIKDANDLYRSSKSVKAFGRLIEEHTVEIDAPADETLDLEAFLAIAEQDIQWLIRDLLARGEIALVAAPQKTYKTWLVIVMVRALATGGDFLQEGWRSTARHRVLVVEEEGNEVKFAQRLRTANFDGHVHIRHRKGSDLTSPEFVDALIAQVQGGAYDVLVLDPLQRMAPGVNENDAGEMGRLWDSIHRIARECPTSRSSSSTTSTRTRNSAGVASADRHARAVRSMSRSSWNGQTAARSSSRSTGATFRTTSTHQRRLKSRSRSTRTSVSSR